MTKNVQQRLHIFEKNALEEKNGSKAKSVVRDCRQSALLLYPFSSIPWSQRLLRTVLPPAVAKLWTGP
jgi:hypothetical protein